MKNVTSQRIEWLLLNFSDTSIHKLSQFATSSPIHPWKEFILVFRKSSFQFYNLICVQFVNNVASQRIEWLLLNISDTSIHKTQVIVICHQFCPVVCPSMERIYHSFWKSNFQFYNLIYVLSTPFSYNHMKL